MRTHGGGGHSGPVSSEERNRGDGIWVCVLEGLCLGERLDLFHGSPAAERGPMNDIDQEGDFS